MPANNLSVEFRSFRRVVETQPTSCVRSNRVSGPERQLLMIATPKFFPAALFGHNRPSVLEAPIHIVSWFFLHIVCSACNICGDRGAFSGVLRVRGRYGLRTNDGTRRCWTHFSVSFPVNWRDSSFCLDGQDSFSFVTSIISVTIDCVDYLDCVVGLVADPWGYAVLWICLCILSRHPLGFIVLFGLSGQISFRRVNYFCDDWLCGLFGLRASINLRRLNIEWAWNFWISAWASFGSEIHWARATTKLMVKSMEVLLATKLIVQS